LTPEFVNNFNSCGSVNGSREEGHGDHGIPFVNETLTHGLPIGSAPQKVNEFNSCQSVNRSRGRGVGRALSIGAPSQPQTPSASPLQLQAKIALGEVQGRIDHMAIDLARQRLFVAEFGNNTVGVVDLRERKVSRTMLEPELRKAGLCGLS
jgi:hypothetical protein